jgi:hypothetical protein
MTRYTLRVELIRGETVDVNYTGERLVHSRHDREKNSSDNDLIEWNDFPIEVSTDMSAKEFFQHVSHEVSLCQKECITDEGGVLLI